MLLRNEYGNILPVYLVYNNIITNVDGGCRRRGDSYPIHTARHRRVGIGQYK